MTSGVFFVSQKRHPRSFLGVVLDPNVWMLAEFGEFVKK
jgi:hypothetical protein